MESALGINYWACSGLLQEEKGIAEKRVLKQACCPGHKCSAIKKQQKVKETIIQVMLVFAIRSEAVGKRLVQRVETKAAEAHVKTFRARNPFVRAQKQAPFSSLSPGRPRLSKAEIRWVCDRESWLAVGEEQPCRSWMWLLAKKGVWWRGIWPNPE